MGNEKTEKDSALLLHQVKKIKPDCLNAMPSMFKWRVGLEKALRTTNPYVPLSISIRARVTGWSSR